MPTGTVTPESRFAQVVVLVPLDPHNRWARDQESAGAMGDYAVERQTFTYGIPPGRRGQYCAGQVVWVPFGRSKQQGLIFRLAHTAPEDVTIKSLGEPITAQAALTPAQLDLAQWMSHTYMAPLSECVKLILPPGFGARMQVMVEATPGVSIDISTLTPAQQALLLRLRREPLSLSQIRDMDSRLAADEVLGVLLTDGLAQLRELVAGRSRPKPKIERWVHLSCTAAEARLAVLRLGRRSKGAEILDWLLHHDLQEEGVTEAALLGNVANATGALQDLMATGVIERDLGGQLSLPAGHEAAFEVAVALRSADRYWAVLKDLIERSDAIPVSELYESTGIDAGGVRRLQAAGLIRLEERQVWRDPLAGQEVVPDTPPSLTADQKQAWDRISQGLDTWINAAERGIPSPPEHPPIYLLHGVTGSGKTELYLRALQCAIEAGYQGIVLVPEISLTPQTVKRFAARFPGRVAVVHSKLSEGERYDTWQRARQGEIDVVVGSRSALFTPLPRPGVIVVDEEHDAAYKQIRTPRYHARDAAIMLARFSSAITLLGSATPALESSFQARQQIYTLLRLPRRVMGHQDPSVNAVTKMLELPPVQIIDMRDELRQGNRSMFSRSLHQALDGVLSRGEQAILFLNRRGSASFVLCRDCGHVVHCPRCAIPLTHHRGDVLICHHCNYRQPMTDTCPKCGSKRFRQFGAGTQRLIDALKAEFPQARPLRWDRDTTSGKTSHDDLLADFIAHRADVLVGTQMIAKGLDLPLVTLVGVLSADIGLFLPDFRAAERVFQVLTQVAGRAGRSALGGEVIFQTYHPDHYAVVAASQHDYAAFYRTEMRFRQENGYPPYRRLTRLLYLDSDRIRCQNETTRVAVEIKQRTQDLNMLDCDLIGPAPAFFSKERGKYRWHLFLRCDQPHQLLAGMQFSPHWRIDVDPVDTL